MGMASKCLRNQKRPALYGANFIILVFTQKSNRAIFDLPVIAFIRQKKKPIAKAIGFFGTSNGNRTHDFALRGQRLNRLTMEAYGWGTRIRT